MPRWDQPTPGKICLLLLLTMRIYNRSPMSFNLANVHQFRTPLNRVVCPSRRSQIIIANPVTAPRLQTIGIIAGNRSLPLEFARQARKQGIARIIAVAFEGETEPELGSLVDEIVW